MGRELKVFTLAEVSKHNNSKDCWLVINGKMVGVGTERYRYQKLQLQMGEGLAIMEDLIQGDVVYDVTKFLEDHPGGDEVLLSATGKDATDDFEDVGHSTSARAMMDEYLVGEIDASTFPSKPKYTPPKQPYYNQDKTSEFIIKILQFLVPLAILGLAVAIRFYTKSS